MIWVIVFLVAALATSVILNVALLRVNDKVSGYWFGLMNAGREQMTALTQVHTPPAMDWTAKQPGVYVIKAHGWTKIGRASDVARRLHEHSTSIPRGFEVVAIFLCEQPAILERQLHQRFASARKRGEWFHLGEPVLNSLATEARQYKGL